MSTRPDASLPPSFFDAIYAEAPDPWSFATSPYEREKYALTLSELPRERYRSAFEIGCSIGVLTEQLARHCESLLSVDVAERALAEAQARCADLPHVSFRLLRVPETFPDASFDLIVVSEVGYYWSPPDLLRARDLIVEHLAPGGHLMLVHFTNEVAEYPISGDAVHEAFLNLTACPSAELEDTNGKASSCTSEPADGHADPKDASPAPLRHLRGRRERRGDFAFRLDLFERRP